MPVTDSIADMLTRIRNAGAAKQEKVDIPASKVIVSIAKILKNEGFVRNYKLLKDGKQGMLRVFLRYDTANQGVIMGLKRISKPGRRVYVAKDEIPLVLNGMGISVLSTSKGVVADREAKRLCVGGELLCTVW